MKAVHAELFRQDLPVGSQYCALWGPQHFHSAIGTAEQHVGIELEIAEIFIEGESIHGRAGEDEPSIELHPGFYQAELRLRIDLAMHFVLRAGSTDESAIRPECPPVVAANKRWSVTCINRRE